MLKLFNIKSLLIVSVIACRVVLSSGVVNAQNFDKRFAIDIAGADFVLRDQTGNLYIVGLSSGLDILVTKIDSSGILIWSKRYGEPLWREVVKDAIIAPNGQLYLCGFTDRGPTIQGFVTSLDTSGAQVFTKRYGVPTEYTAFINCIGENNGMVVTAFYDRRDTLAGTKVLKMDWDGNIYKQVVLQYMSSNKIFKFGDEEYIFYRGNFTVIDSALQASRLYRMVAPLGNIVGRLINGLDNRVYGVGLNEILRFDSLLQPIPSVIFTASADNYPGFIYDAQQIESDSGWMIIGAHHHEITVPGFKDHVVIFRTDAQFNVINTSCLDSDLYMDNDVIHDCKTVLFNEQLTFTTIARYDSINIRGSQFRVVSMDSTLFNSCSIQDTLIRRLYRNLPYFNVTDPATLIPCTTPVFSVVLPQWDEYLSTGDCSDLTVGIKSTSSEVEAINLYPNPCSKNLNITLPPGIDFDGYYLIYSYTGALMQKGKYGSQREFQIRTDQLVPGFYLLRFGNSNKTVRFIRE